MAITCRLFQHWLKTLFILLTTTVAYIQLGGCDVDPLQQAGKRKKSISDVNQIISTVPPLHLYETIGGDFTMTDYEGDRFDLKDHRGEVILLAFGFTFCPDACPMLMSKIYTVNTLVEEEGNSFLTIFVSVDPERDTPKVLKSYLEYFEVPSVGLTGTEAELDRVLQLFNSKTEVVQIDSPDGYTIDHSTFVFLIDELGRVRYTFRPTDSPALMASVIKQVRGYSLYAT